MPRSPAILARQPWLLKSPWEAQWPRYFYMPDGDDIPGNLRLPFWVTRVGEVDGAVVIAIAGVSLDEVKERFKLQEAGESYTRAMDQPEPNQSMPVLAVQAGRAIEDDDGE